MDQYFLDQTPVLVESLDTNDSVTVAVYDLSDGSSVTLSSSSATEINSSGMYRWEVDFQTQPTNAKHYYLYSFTGTYQTRWGTFEWSWRPEEYDGVVHIDTTNGSSGTGYPLGLPATPVDNLADALTIAGQLGSTELHVKGSITLAGGPFTAYTFRGASAAQTTITLGNQVVTNAIFSDMTLTGVQNGAIEATRCSIGSVTNMQGSYSNCAFTANMDLLAGTTTNIIGGGSVGAVSLDIDFNATAVCAALEAVLYCTPKNMTNPGSVFLKHGHGTVVIDSSNTAGTLIIAGEASKSGTGGGVTVVNDTTRYMIWEEPVADHETSGTSGETLKSTAFGGIVYLDTGSGNSGTAFPTGTPFHPVDNITDAKTIADANEINTISVTGSITLNATFDGFVFKGASIALSTIDLNNQSVDNTSFDDLTLSGQCNGTIRGNNIALLNITDLDGDFTNTAIDSNITIDSAGEARFRGGQVRGAVQFTIDLNGTGKFAAADFTHFLTITNINNITGLVVLYGDGLVTIDSTVTSGVVIIGNAVNVINNGTPAIYVDQTNASMTWNRASEDYNDAGSMGEIQNLIPATYSGVNNVQAQTDQINFTGGNIDSNLVTISGDAVAPTYIDASISSRSVPGDNMNIAPSGLTAIDTTLSATHGAGSWETAAASNDWSTAEREQIRDALGVDGTKTAATGGQVQDILADTAAVQPLVDVAVSTRSVPGDNMNLTPSGITAIDTELTSTHGAGAWTSDSAVDWSVAEKEQIRSALGVNGDKTTAVSGQIQDILGDTVDIQSRIPAALIGGRMDSDVGNIQANTVDATALAIDAVNEIRDSILADSIAFNGANIDAAISSRAVAGDAMDLVTDAVDSDAMATTGVNEIRDSILADSTSFNGASIAAILTDTTNIDSNVDVAVSTRATPGDNMNITTSGITGIDTELTSAHGAGSWQSAASSSDWSTAEREQIRSALGVDGDKTTAVSGQMQDILTDTAAIDSRLPADPADESNQLAQHTATQAAIAAIDTLLGTPEGATISADLATLLARLTAVRAAYLDDISGIDTSTTLVQKILRNKLVLADGDSGNWVLYDDDGVTPLLTWSVTDKDGNSIVQPAAAPSQRTRGV